MSLPERERGRESVALPVPFRWRWWSRRKAEAGQPEKTGAGRRDFLVRRALAFSDTLAIAGAASIAFLISPVDRGSSDYLWILPTLPLWVVGLGLYGLYHRDAKRINHQALDDLSAIFHALVVGTLVMWVYFRLISDHNLVLQEVAVFGALGLVAIPLLRTGTRHLTRAVLGPERILFVGEGPVVPPLVRKIRDHPEYGIRPVGLVSHAPVQGGWVGPIPVLGRLGDGGLPDLVSEHGVERVIISQFAVSDDSMVTLLQECRELSLKISVLPSQFEVVGPSAEVDDIEGVTVLGLNPLTLSRSARFLKRSMDLVGSLVGLVLLAPLIALIAVAVKLDSEGSVLFWQDRIGRGGRRFRLLKFRTMVADAESRAEELLAHSQDPNWLKLERDPRVTRIGRWLRLASLDELPQLWNVLRGDMSLVGPRPLVGTEDERVTGWTRTRLDLSPGITGLWQVLGRTNIPFEEMIKLDTIYVTNWSLWLDIKLLLRTFPVVVTRRGAN